MHAIALAGSPPTPTQMVGLALFFIFWFVVSLHLVALTSGWKKLALRFRYESPFIGTTWRWQCARFRYGMNYNNCLTVGASPDGLYLAMMPFFNFGHAALLIPWSEIAEASKNTLFGPVFVLTLGSEEKIPVTIRPKLALKIEQAKKQNFPVG